MSLAAGTRLGPYEIISPLGAGGMGEVYRARDSRLGRDVAVKVLPDDLSSSPEIRARFEREAKTISSLNHPNICTLFDVGHEGDTSYLVMELVEGETLAARLERGALAAEPLLKIAVEITDALDRAHRSGIVHRDLKPGNVMLTRSGAKLMDFGLARATGLASAAGTMSQTPTMSRPLTVEGTIVGTFQYMAPEQLEGGEPDARADLWALGCVLYEMATGKRAFEGKSQASLIGAIMHTEPAPMSTLAPLAPPALERIVRACLAKDPNDRIQTAHDVKLQLQWISEGGSQAGVPAPVAARRRSREALAWAIAGITTIAVVTLGAMLLLRRPSPPRVDRFSVEAPEGMSGINWPRLSPDGRQLAFLASDSTGKPHIWLRPIDAFEAHALPGGDAPGRPFWSPDGRFLAYFLDGKFKKLPVAGGPPVTLADAPGAADGSWGSRSVVIFDGISTDSLRVVPAAGGAVKPASRLDRAAGESGHAWPFFLPDGQHFLFVAFTNAGQRMKVGVLGSWNTVDLGATDGRVEYTWPGYIVFPREGTLLAQPFDLRALKTTGDPVPVGEKVSMGQAAGYFTLSNEGTLSYSTATAGEVSRLVWADRTGRVLSEASPPDAYQDVALSPDGQSAVVGIVDSRSRHQDLWVRHLTRGVTSRLTFGGGENVWPIWSPDGSRIAWASNRSGRFRTYLRPATGAGREDSLKTPRDDNEGPWDWSRDGRWILTTARGSTKWDLWTHRTDGDPTPVVLLQTGFSERSPRLSPDGRWLAYQSNESGRNEIYIQPFPGPGGKWQVSTDGGREPQWRGDGKELFYVSLDRRLMAVAVTAGEGFESGNPSALFRMRLVDPTLTGSGWAVTADGQRFLLNSPVNDIGAARFAVVTNWASELGKR